MKDNKIIILNDNNKLKITLNNEELNNVIKYAEITYITLNNGISPILSIVVEEKYNELIKNINEKSILLFWNETKKEGYKFLNLNLYNKEENQPFNFLFGLESVKIELVNNLINN